MKQKIRTFFWYVKRPKLYPQMLSDACSFFRKPSHHDDTRQEAENWCKHRAVDTDKALEIITGTRPLKPVRVLFHEYFEIADKMYKRCPAAMGGPGDIDLLYWLAEHSKARRVIETGVAYGWSSLALLLSLNSRKDSQLVSTDMPYKNRNNDKYVGCVVPLDLSTHWRIIRQADKQAIPKAIKQLRTYDMCHYDSDKRYDARMWAYPLLWKHLKSGGIFISDDISDNIAFKNFSDIVSIKPLITKKDKKYIGILLKD